MKMQEKVLGEIEKIAHNHKLELVISYGASNTGYAYIMDGLDIVLTISFNFQTSYCSIKIYYPGVEPEGSNYIMPGSNGYLEYYKSRELKALILFFKEYMEGYDEEKNSELGEFEEA